MRTTTTALPILPTPGLTHPRFTRLRFNGADAGSQGTPGAGTAAPSVDQGATGTGTGSPSTAPAAGNGTSTATDGTQTGTGDTAPEAGNGTNLPPDVAARELAQARSDAVTYRERLRTAEQQTEALTTALRAAGILPDDGSGNAPDPAELQASLESERTSARLARVELAAYRAAARAGVDGDGLLDSRTFLESVRNLDPTADTFGADVEAAVKAAADANPRLRQTATLPGPTATDHGGGSGEAGDASKADPGRSRLEAAYAASPARR